MRLYCGHPGFGPNLIAEIEPQAPGSPHSRPFHQGLLTCSFNKCHREKNIQEYVSSFVYVYHPPPKKNGTETSYLRMGRCPGQPSWKQTSLILLFPRYQGMVWQYIGPRCSSKWCLWFKVLVQTTSSKALVFPACLGFHTTAWGDVHLLGHLL